MSDTNTSSGYETSGSHFSQGVISGQGIGEVYPKLLQYLLSSGKIVNPRGQRTVELLGVQVRLEDARRNVLVSQKRNPNYRFMVAEWLWIWFGMNEVEPVARYNSKIRAFSDDGRTFAGAYGPRLASQWEYAVKALNSDFNSRQAVMSIWSPSPLPSRDIPCTLTFQFFIRDNRLHMIANMRSSDAWLGIPYDVFNFTMLQNIVAAYCHRQIGSFVLNIGSSHLYEQDWVPASEILAANDLKSPKFETDPEGALKGVLRGEIPIWKINLPWRFYADALRAKTSAEAFQELTLASLMP